MIRIPRWAPVVASGTVVALILLVALAIYMGWITPHGVGRNPG